MRARVTSQLFLSLLALIVTVAVGSAQDRGGGAGAQGAGRGGGGRGPALVTLTVASTSFADGAEIPAKFTGGQGVSPQLSWSGAPSDTAGYVLIMHDVDVAIPAGSMTNDITHWVVW